MLYGKVDFLIFMYNVIRVAHTQIFYEASIEPLGSWTTELLEANANVKCKMQPNGFDCSLKNVSSVARYYYDIKMQTCLAFDYYECPYSFNNFYTLFECHEYCRVAGPSSIPRQKPAIYCRLQPDFGDCNEYHTRYYFDITIRSCKGFAYSGCGGNRNRFSTRQQCAAQCTPVMGAMDDFSTT